MHMRLLIIEDNVEFVTLLKNRLEEKCFAVDNAYDGDRGLFLAKTNEYDLILLDCALPGKSGFEICKELRFFGKHTPIIIISVSNDTPKKVAGLELGADDYLGKPFLFDELYARIQAVLRRPPIQNSCILAFGDLTLDTNKQRVTRGKDAIYLTKKEFSLLEYLMKHAGAVVSRGEIMEHIWDANLDPFSNTIETHILNLRKKLHSGNRKKIIHSVPGRGYKIDIHK